MENLELNEQHQNIVQNYLKFTKYLRNQNLKSVEMFFESTVDSRLSELTYTRDEVETMLQSLKDLIRAEMETELISFSHMNVLLLGQLFNQAEKWHLRMTADLSEIQNRDLLENVKSIELNKEIKVHSDRPKLQPLVDNIGSIELLRKEIERLKAQNQSLETRLTEMKFQIVALTEDKVRLTTLYGEKEEETNALRLKTEELLSERGTISNKSDSEILLGEYEKVLSEQLRLELVSMKEEVLRAQSQLSLAEQELDKKFNETTAYLNMKTMIAKKNEQVKELREQLRKFQNPNTDVNDD